MMRLFNLLHCCFTATSATALFIQQPQSKTTCSSSSLRRQRNLCLYNSYLDSLGEKGGVDVAQPTQGLKNSHPQRQVNLPSVEIAQPPELDPPKPPELQPPPGPETLDPRSPKNFDSVGSTNDNNERCPQQQSPTHHSPPSSSFEHSSGKQGIGELLMQRAIQTQLYYLADLRDEPTYMWLREFLGHDHLDDRGRFNELDGLRCSNGWRGYLEQLEQAPPFTILVQLAPPKLSAQQMRNPYLAKQQATGRSYEETIMPVKISQTLRTVARSLEKEWVPLLTELAVADNKRVEQFDFPQLQSTAGAYSAEWLTQRVAGGEGDDQDTPLHSLNRRIVARYCTRVALLRIVEELKSVSLPVEATADEDEKNKRNLLRIAEDLKGVSLPGLEDEKNKINNFAAVDAQAVQWLSDFSRKWLPKLVRGADDEKRRQLGVAPPGHWQLLCDGADGDDVTEALWQELPPMFCYINDDAMQLYSPDALAARLRRARASVCEELVEELRAEILAMS